MNKPALIAMACYDTVANARSQYTKATLISLANTVDLTKHRLVIIDNGSCQKTKDIIFNFINRIRHDEKMYLATDQENITVITNDDNKGTATAINQAWALREIGQAVVKIDNDIVIHQPLWIEDMQEAIVRSESTSQPLGICGLKRKDLAESPHRTDWAHSQVIQLPHEPGQRWMYAEYVQHVMGSCCMFSPRLIEKIGGLVQNGLYGFDDSLAAVRAQVAGFYCAFIPYIEIDHIDPGDNPYLAEKQRYAGERMDWFHKVRKEYIDGVRDVYVEINPATP